MIIVAKLRKLIPRECGVARISLSRKLLPDIRHSTTDKMSHGFSRYASSIRVLNDRKVFHQVASRRFIPLFIDYLFAGSNTRSRARSRGRGLTAGETQQWTSVELHRRCPLTKVQ